jgi:YidC/Oxa1 family membrane protein insertase
MEKRVLAAIALSIAILFAFRYYEERRAAEQAKLMPPVTRQVPATPPPPASAAPKTPAPPPELPPVMPLPAEQSVPEQKVVIVGDLYRAVLENRGGVLTSWQLKQYKSAKGEAFDMVAATHVEQRSYPTSLVFDDSALTALANQENYAVEIVDGKSAGTSLTAPATVVMRLRRGDLLIEKRFHFEDKNFLVEFAARIQRGNQAVRGRILLGQDIGPEQEHLLNPSIQLTAVADLGGKIQREAAPKNENEVKTISGDVRWAGLDIQYFALIAIPSQPVSAFEIQRRPAQTVGLSGEQLTRNLIRVTMPADGTGAYRIYLGPKMQTYLDGVPGGSLAGVINYGMFSVIVKPLLVGLRFINQYTHNFGLAIILLTFVLTLLLFPFRLKQMVSMKKMQVLQPKIKEIQEKYKRYKKTDPKRAEMNQEVMAIYKEHKVNPLGGCLPLLLQMPLLFAFYSLLAYSIELRQAPFFGWLHDLSMKDSYYILPIVMGITMLISQKMTPMSPGADPTQAKMMMIMPVVFTVFFLNVSSGLNLYFLCSNVFQIAFQKVAERWIGDRGSVSKSKS